MPNHPPSKKAQRPVGILYAALAARIAIARPPIVSLPERPKTPRPEPTARSRNVALGELFRGIPWTQA